MYAAKNRWQSSRHLLQGRCHHQAEQTTIIDDDKLAASTAMAVDVSGKQVPIKRRPGNKKPTPFSKPKTILKAVPTTCTPPPPVVKYVPAVGPPLAPAFGIEEFLMYISSLVGSLPLCVCDNDHFYMEKEDRPSTTGEPTDLREGTSTSTMTRKTAMTTIMQDRLQERYRRRKRTTIFLKKSYDY